MLGYLNARATHPRSRDATVILCVSVRLCMCIRICAVCFPPNTVSASHCCNLHARPPVIVPLHPQHDEVHVVICSWTWTGTAHKSRQTTPRPRWGRSGSTCALARQASIACSLVCMATFHASVRPSSVCTCMQHRRALVSLPL